MKNTEQRRNQEQRRDRRDQETANHCASQRSILLAAFAKCKGHRQHADDHGERGHQHRAKAREARFQRRGRRIQTLR